MSLCLLHVYDVSKTDSEGTNVTVLRLNAVGRYTALGGIFHGGIEVNGEEWSYGFCEKGTGVYKCTPKENPMYQYRETVTLGVTTLSEHEVRQLLRQLKERWEGKKYDLLGNNCNHFCQEFSEKLRVNGIPGWLNRMAFGAEAVASMGAATAEQMRWLGSVASSWLSGWTSASPEQCSEKSTKAPAAHQTPPSEHS